MVCKSNNQCFLSFLFPTCYLNSLPQSVLSSQSVQSFKHICLVTVYKTLFHNVFILKFKCFTMYSHSYGCILSISVLSLFMYPLLLMHKPIIKKKKKNHGHTICTCVAHSALCIPCESPCCLGYA